jgi:hypothetical protein
MEEDQSYSAESLRGRKPLTKSRSSLDDLPAAAKPPSECLTTARAAHSARNLRGSLSPPAASTFTPPLDPSTPVNAFGWVGRVDAKSRAREAGREVKWLEMSANFREFRKAHGGLFLRRVLKGIPDSMRARSWLFLLNNKSERIERAMEPVQGTVSVDRRRLRYERWLGKVTRQSRPIIEPELISGLAIISKETVIQLLTAFHKGQATVPYVAAEGIFASILLAYMDEVKAFTAFLYLLSGPKRLAKNYYDNEIVAGITEVWLVLVKLKNVPMYERLEKLGVDHMEYMKIWLRTVFLTTQFPLPLRLMLFDRFIAYGTRAIFSFGLILLHLLADRPEMQSAASAVAILKEPTPLFGSLDWEKVLAKGDSEFISKTVYGGLFTGAKIYRIP